MPPGNCVSVQISNSREFASYELLQHKEATLGNLQTMALHQKAVACHAVVMHVSFRRTLHESI